MMLHSDHRVSRGMVYVVLLLAGISSYTPLNVTFIENLTLKIVGVFLIVGSVISLIGYGKKENHIEILGSPLLVTAMTVLTAKAFISNSAEDPTRYFTGLILAAFTCSLLSRYRDLQALISIREHMRSGN